MGAGIVLYSLYDTATPIAFDRSIASLDPDMRSPMLPLEVSEQCVTTRLGEVFAYDYTQHLHLLRVRRHGVGWDNPTALTELMSAAHD